MAWPAVALNSLQTINSLLDSFFIQHLGVASLTAMGASVNILFLFVPLTMALGTAATALVSRAFGANDRNGYVIASQKCLGMALISGLIFALISVPGSFMASHVLLPDSASASRNLMLHYLGVFALGLPGIFIVQVLAGALRGVGDTRSPMVISGIQILLHIALNGVLINKSNLLGPLKWSGLGWGLTGAAAAMSISAWIAAIVYLLYGKKTPLGSCFRCSWPGRDWSPRIIRIAVPAAMMSVVRVTSLMAFTAILTRVPHGETAVGAFRPAFAVESLAFMPGFGLSVTAAALVGQSLGMQRPDRAEKIAWKAAHHAAIAGLIASIIVLIFAQTIAGVLVPDQPVVAHHVAEYLKYVCLTEILFGYAMVLTGALQGAGDTVSPFWLALGCMWGLRVPMAFLFASVFAWGTVGCWIAMSATQGIQGILAILVFRTGKWKLKQV